MLLTYRSPSQVCLSICLREQNWKFGPCTCHAHRPDCHVDWKCILRRSPDEAQAVCTASELCLLSEGPHLPDGPVLRLFKVSYFLLFFT